jgi:sarcosine oxidase subunit beta
MGRLSVLETLPIRPGWWGYYGMSPDHNAVIGGGDVDGLLFATGFSGHGFQQAPVVGEYLADVALERPPAFDLSPLSLARFQGAEVRPEANII